MTRERKPDFYVYSTLTADNIYAAGQPGEGGMIVPVEGVLIKGGSNLINRNLITPRGAVITGVTAEQLDRLQADTVFQMHKANGFITVSEKLEDGEKVASADLESRDGSAQLTPEDYELEGKTPPKVGDAQPQPAVPQPPARDDSKRKA